MEEKRGLLKEVSELSTLCRAEAWAIIYGPNDAQSDVWPTPAEAGHMLCHSESMPKFNQSKNMLNKEGVFSQRIENVKGKKLARQQVENLRCEIPELMHKSFMGKELQDVATEELHYKAWFTLEMMEVQKRIDELKKVPLGMPPPRSIPEIRRDFVSDISVAMGPIQSPVMPPSHRIPRDLNAFASEIPDFMGLITNPYSAAFSMDFWKLGELMRARSREINKFQQYSRPNGC